MESSKKIDHRTDLQLIELCRDAFSVFKDSECWGLCQYIEELMNNGLITYSEKERLRAIFYRNIFRGSNFFDRLFRDKRQFSYDSRNCHTSYFWTPKESKPRLEFLNYLRDKYQNK